MRNGGGKQRKSLRLRGFDYAGEGAYFVTLVTHCRDNIFGSVNDNKVELSTLGHIAYKEWFCSADIRKEVELFEDEFVIMPNHLHGIIWIIEPISKTSVDDIKRKFGVAATGRLPLRNEESRVTGPRRKSLGSFVSGYKSAVTTKINKIQKTPRRLVWQPNYFDRIVRNERELNALREYMRDNPVKWETDNYYLD